MNANTRQLNKVKSLENFFNLLPSLYEKSNKNLYYRGQNNSSFKLSPSLFRKSGWENNEHDAYMEIMTECSQEFIECKFHNEILSKMQHYGLPTRLLDVTTNALVALYFACEGDENNDGAVFVIEPQDYLIKNYESDTVSILASIPRLSHKDQNALRKEALSHTKFKKCDTDDIKKFNKKDVVKRLLHEIKKEKPAFENLIDPSNLLNNYLLIPRKSNPRIIRQSGAFIIFGLNYKEINEQFEGNEKKINLNKIIICKSEKRNILEQLKACGITTASLNPELYKVTEFVKERYKNK